MIGCCVFCVLKQRRSGEEHYTNEKKPSKKKFSELKSTGYSKVNPDETLPMKAQQTVPMRLDSSTEVEV